MDKSLRAIQFDLGYSTSNNELIEEFYIPCLNASTNYDRAVGYFRSSLFAIIGLALSDFALRNGRFRLVCSPSLSKDDINAIKEGYSLKDRIDSRINRELDQLLQFPGNQSVLKLLSTLIATGAMEIKIAYRENAAGIFHSKVGVFKDKNDSVSFSGSSNETFFAWDQQGNHEIFEVFTSWGDERERVLRHQEYFQRLWASKEQGIATCNFPDLSESRLREMKDDLGLAHAIEAVRDEWSRNIEKSPPVLTVGMMQPRVLLPHQIAVIESWVANKYYGIIDHATGSGKTVGALHGIKLWIRDGRPALIVVPSEILVNQWGDEARRELGLQTAFLFAGAGEGRDAWSSQVADFTRNVPALGPRVIIATMQTASSTHFLNKIQAGDHLLLVADEVHRIGSPQHRSLLGIDVGGALGLSATPERYGDPEGSRLIFDFFKEVLEPSFGIADAIAAGRLVPYDYYIHQVSLTEGEQESWDEATLQISKAYARLPVGDDGRKIRSKSFDLLLIKRAWITKKAALKVDLAHEVIHSEFVEGDRWIIYCDDQDQLTSVLYRLSEEKFYAFEYHSNMLGSRSDTLKYFEDRGGIMVAIRCLDEGVDIPLVNKALILASSTNPREFIQRRGRVLRTAPGKYSSSIHDALVIPAGDYSEDDSKVAILRTELRRSRNFATSARNTSVRHELEIIARRAGLQWIKGIEFEVEGDQEEYENDS